MAHARRLDRQHSPQGTTPIEDRLRWFTDTRGLVSGAYGEASADVHDLLQQASWRLAGGLWRVLGARNVNELRGFLLSRMRRRVGLAAVQAMARHRLLRVPFVGASHAAVAARTQRGQYGEQQEQWRRPQWFAHEFFAHEARSGEQGGE